MLRERPFADTRAPTMPRASRAPNSTSCVAALILLLIRCFVQCAALEPSSEVHLGTNATAQTGLHPAPPPPLAGTFAALRSLDASYDGQGHWQPPVQPNAFPALLGAAPIGAARSFARGVATATVDLELPQPREGRAPARAWAFDSPRAK